MQYPTRYPPNTLDSNGPVPKGVSEAGASGTGVRRRGLALPLFCAVLAASLVSVRAASDVEVAVSIKGHSFDPAELRVPAGAAVTLTVENLDASPAEFESHALDVEKIIVGNGTATIRLRPLAAGSYPFVEEFHEDTAKGVLIAE